MRILNKSIYADNDHGGQNITGDYCLLVQHNKMIREALWHHLRAKYNI